MENETNKKPKIKTIYTAAIKKMALFLVAEHMTYKEVGDKLKIQRGLIRKWDMQDAIIKAKAYANHEK